MIDLTDMMRGWVKVVLSVVVLTSSDCLLAQQAGMFDELTPLYPDSGAHRGSVGLSSLAPRGGVTGVHILLDRLASNEEVTVKIHTKDDVSIGQLLPVDVKQNTGLQSRTELRDGKLNPHVIRRAPFQVYDAIRLVPSRIAKADDSGRLALRLEYVVPRDAKPGLKTYKVELIAGSWKQQLTWEVEVHAAVLAESQPGYTNWFSVENLANYHGHALWSPGHWEMIEQAAMLMREQRQTMFWIPWRLFFGLDADGTLKVDDKRLDRYVRIFLEAGFKQVELGHLAERENGAWGAKHLVSTLGKLRVDSEKGKKLLMDQLAAIQRFVHRHQLEGKVYQHISDEPLSAHAGDYVMIAKWVHEHLPEAPVFDAVHCTTELVGAVDVWCPQLDIYYRHRDFFQQRIQAGEQVWVYTCLSPGGAALNRLLDQERTRCVLLSWFVMKEGLSGYLHWGLNHYRKGNDPYRETSPQFDDKPGPSRNFLPPGDSHVAYPDPVDKRLLSSVRLCAHRLGMEDAAMLSSIPDQKLDVRMELIGQLIREPKQYVMSVEKYRSSRKSLMESVSGLKSTPR